MPSTRPLAICEGLATRKCSRTQAAESLSIHLGANEWRVQIGVAAIPSLLFFMALGLIPRSPRWLVKQGRMDEAETALRQLGFPDTFGEVQLMQSSFDRNPEGANILRSCEFRKPLLIALALGFFSQFTGINAILYNVNDIFAHAGFASISAGGQAVVVGMANLLFTVVGMALIDRVGRKPLLLAGSVGMSLALAGVTAAFYTGLHQNLLLPLLVIFIAFFAASQGAVMWVYLSEIFPNQVRDAGQSIASLWLWFLTAVITGAFPTIAARSTGFPFLIFCVANLVQFLSSLGYFPRREGVRWKLLLLSSAKRSTASTSILSAVCGCWLSSSRETIST